ncbi:MAG: phage/plasmid primase, P4 family [bacterium]|nr:phage/plasmid primase, P4 family [bacterium]
MQRSEAMNLLDAALFHHSQGCAVVAVSQKKVPYREGWGKYFTQAQTEAEVRELFSNGAFGVAMVLWPASRYGVLDDDGPHAEEAWAAMGIERPQTAKHKTMHGGTHHFYLMPDIELPENLKRKIRLAEIKCDCKDDKGEPHYCGVDLLIKGIAVIPPTPGYKEDADHPLETAVLIPSEILALIQKKPTPKERITGDEKGRVHHGLRNVTACSLAGTMRARGTSIEGIEALLKADSEKRFDPPLDANEIENVLKSAAKWAEGSTVVFEHCTDMGNARRLVNEYGQDIRHSTQSGFYVWDGKRWEQDSDGAVERFAKATVRGIYNEAAQCDDKDVREKIASHAHKSESDARIKAMIAQARTELEIVVKHDDLDRDPWLLNVNNGTLNLKTGELQPHSHRDLITRLIPIDYREDAACPLWLRFLDRVAGSDGERMRFLQKAVGYSLTGSTREQILLILYGLGANGKSTFLKILLWLFADYGKQTGTETLLVKRGDQIPNDVARLAGARFVSAVETESGRRLAEGLVKQLTGGDRITARFLHHEFFEFEPPFKIWLAVNHKPRIVGTDHAIWRRIRLIPFTVTIPESERDPDLADKLKAELPGVLAWAVAGCEMWQMHGLKAPRTVTEATATYREESDPLTAFLDDRCVLEPGAEVGKTELYKAFKEWAQEAGERELSRRDFNQRVAERGYEDGRNRKTRFWEGLKLAEL